MKFLSFSNCTAVGNILILKIVHNSIIIKYVEIFIDKLNNIL